MPLLITQAEIAALPPDPRQRFVAIEEICRTRHEEKVRDEEQWSFIQDARLQYMAAVVGAAKYLKIDPICQLDIPRKSEWNDNAYEDFQNDLNFYAMQLALEGAERSSRESVVLQGTTKDRLLTLCSHLREQVRKLDLPASKIDSLLSRVEAFEHELGGPRLTFVAVATMALFFAATVADLGGAASTVKHLVFQVEEVVGGAKAEQDKEAAGRLGTVEIKKLSAPRKVRGFSAKPPADTFQIDLDEEIPF